MKHWIKNLINKLRNHLHGKEHQIVRKLEVVGRRIRCSVEDKGEETMTIIVGKIDKLMVRNTNLITMMILKICMKILQKRQNRLREEKIQSCLRLNFLIE